MINSRVAEQEESSIHHILRATTWSHGALSTGLDRVIPSYARGSSLFVFLHSSRTLNVSVKQRSRYPCDTPALSTHFYCIYT